LTLDEIDAEIALKSHPEAVAAAKVFFCIFFFVVKLARLILRPLLAPRICVCVCRVCVCLCV
jgi:hypothetical protein